MIVPPVPTPLTRTSIAPRGILPNLGTGGLEVDFRIRRILELLQQNVATGIGRHHFLGLRDGALHSGRTVGEDQVGAKSAQDPAPLHRECFRHDQVMG